MTLKPSNSWRQHYANSTFARNAIPVEVSAPAPGDEPTDWKIMVHGGTLESTIERIRSKQDAIMRRIARFGMENVTRQDALFMYVSQWFDWIASGGFGDPECQEILELMEGWLALYIVRGNRFVN